MKWFGKAVLAALIVAAVAMIAIYALGFAAITLYSLIAVVFGFIVTHFGLPGILFLVLFALALFTIVLDNLAHD